VNARLKSIFHIGSWSVIVPDYLALRNFFSAVKTLSSCIYLHSAVVHFPNRWYLRSFQLWSMGGSWHNVKTLAIEVGNISHHPRNLDFQTDHS